ncbi:MAG TPA: cyanophycin synthetase [Fimbriimonadaceae bacterium]|nr:cyanophycin synthetase [Fimbriimonadaceae bacterium]
MTYPEALAYIASLEPRGWRLGLDRMAEFVRRTGLEAAVNGTERRYIHVAGTNGKGSVTAFLQSLLVESGVRTGAFFSPYVVDPRERIQIGREFISKMELAGITADLRLIAEGMDGTEFSGVTEFEFKTALGFMAWRRAEVEWVALETGLGGRLDATNVVTPAATVIVSIGLDHQSILGETVEKIAFEKAGIIKPGVPLVLGEVPPPAREVILGVAKRAGSKVWEFGKEVLWEPGRGTVSTPAGAFEGLTPALQGMWQGHNLSLAVAALAAVGLELSPDAARFGAASAYAPGRFEKIAWGGCTLILDGAHNADSARALAATLRAESGSGRKVVLLSNMLLGHEPEAFYEPLVPLVSGAVVPPVEFHRRRAPAETAALLRGLGLEAEVAPSVPAALDRCAELAGPGGTILVTGSFYLVGEVARSACDPTTLRPYDPTTLQPYDPI